MQPNFETTVVSFDSDTGIGRIELDRPDSLNALSGQLQDDLVASLQELERHNEGHDGVALRAVSIEGRGGNFCVGADINEFDDDRLRETSERDYMEFVMDFPIPIVAKIEGYCLGGGLELALVCDFRIAHEESTLGLSEVDLGIAPGAGGVQFISSLLSPAVGKEVAMTGEHMTAERAAEFGLLTAVAPDGKLDATVNGLLETLASKPPLAVQAIKKSADYTPQKRLRGDRKLDFFQTEQLIRTDDSEEAVRAFADDDYEPAFDGT